MRTLLTLLGLIASVTASAGSVGPVTLGASQIQVIAAPQIAYVYVTIGGGGCAYGNAAVLIMDSTNPAANAFYATLLSAKTTNSSVTITTSGCSASGYPVISSVYLN